jgi:hypothetical protein
MKKLIRLFLLAAIIFGFTTISPVNSKINSTEMLGSACLGLLCNTFLITVAQFVPKSSYLKQEDGKIFAITSGAILAALVANDCDAPKYTAFGLASVPLAYLAYHVLPHCLNIIKLKIINDFKGDPIFPWIKKKQDAQDIYKFLIMRNIHGFISALIFPAFSIGSYAFIKGITLKIKNILTS